MTDFLLRIFYRRLRRININLIFNNLRCQCKLTASEYLFNIYLIRGFDLESILYCSLGCSFLILIIRCLH